MWMAELAKNMPTTRYRRCTYFYNSGGRHGCCTHNGMGRLGQWFSLGFHPTQQRDLRRLLIGWILCNGRRTITGMIRWADPEGSHAHDAYHRFLRDAVWAMDDLWQGLIIMLVKRFYPRGVIQVDLDDTLFHRSGRKVAGAGWWRDAVRSTGQKVVHAWGLNLVVVTLRIEPPWGGEPLGLPITMRLHRKKEASLIELAGEMLLQIAHWLPERRFLVCADGFYAPLAGQGIERVDIVSRLRRDAVLYDLPPRRTRKTRGRPRKRGRRLAKPPYMAAHVQRWQTVTTDERGQERTRLVYVRQVLWYRVSKTPMLLVISRDPTGREKDDYFITTALDLNGAQVISVFAGRWSIEDTFKHTKQLLGSQEPQSFKRQGPERAAALSLWLYAMVWLWYLQRKEHQRTFLLWPWQTNKTVPSFADALTSLRRELWQARIISMFGKHAVHDKKYEFLIEALAAAA